MWLFGVYIWVLKQLADFWFWLRKRLRVRRFAREKTASRALHRKNKATAHQP
jgi:hypothetical protein